MQLCIVIFIKQGLHGPELLGIISSLRSANWRRKSN